MSNIYEILRPKKGYAYTDEQIVDYSLISIPMALLHKPICKGFFSDIIFK